MLNRLCCSWLSALLCFGMPVPIAACADDSPFTVEQREAIAVLTRLGATVNYQRKKPGTVGQFTLYLHANGSKKFSDKHLAYLNRLPKLELVDLSGTSISDAGLVHLKVLSHLSNLNLSFTRITDDGLTHLSGLTSLWYLYLDGTEITDAGIKHLLPLTNLNNMSLSETGVSRKGSARIAEMLPKIHHDVRKLLLYVDHGEKIARIKERAPWIGMVHFFGGGVVVDSDLVQLSQIPELQRLIVSDSRVTDAGMNVLHSLKSLEYVDISHSLVRGPGLRHLHGLKRLGEIDVSGTSIGAEYIDALKWNLPHCEIRR